MKILDIKIYLSNTLNIHFRKAGMDEVIIKCPNKRHLDNNPSCYLNTKTGLFNCKSCNFSGNLEILSSIVLGRESGIYAYKKESGILNNEDEYIKAKINDILNPQKDIESIDMNRFENYRTTCLQSSPVNLQIISNLKSFVTQDIIDNYQIKHWTDPGIYYNRIAIPIYNLDNEFQNIYFRRINENDKPKYNTLPGTCTEYKTSDILFYSHNCGSFLESNAGLRLPYVAAKLPYVIVTESIFDTLFLEKNNFYSCSVFSNEISFSQINRLYEITNTVILFFDGDDAGLRGTNSCYLKLKNYIPTKVYFELGKDPDECQNLSKLQKIIKNL